MIESPSTDALEEATGNQRSPTWAIAMFVLVVDTSLMNVSISAAVKESWAVRGGTGAITKTQKPPTCRAFADGASRTTLEPCVHRQTGHPESLSSARATVRRIGISSDALNCVANSTSRVFRCFRARDPIA